MGIFMRDRLVYDTFLRRHLPITVAAHVSTHRGRLVCMYMPIARADFHRSRWHGARAVSPDGFGAVFRLLLKMENLPTFTF